MTACTYCGSEVEEHDPVYVEEQGETGRIERGRFCNYACLQAYIEDEDLVLGAACHVDCC
ncbi:MAG: hypothetical protein ABEJ58_03325 [Halodesulfurarchaeum sp.]